MAANAVATSPVNRSAPIRTVLRLSRSIQTPANGPSSICGRNANSPENASIIGEAVSLASHQISENWTAELPSSDTVCPAMTVKKLRRQCGGCMVSIKIPLPKHGHTLSGGRQGIR